VPAGGEAEEITELQASKKEEAQVRLCFAAQPAAPAPSFFVKFIDRLEAISKIVDHAQEQGVSRRKSAAYVEYVSILRRLTTQLLGVRCIFEIASRRVP
jgi:hypothetical protein